MFKNCQSRIRGYLYRAEAQIREGSFKMWADIILMFLSCSEFKTLNKSEKSSVLKVLETLKSDLKQNDFHGSYFDRSAEREERICDGR